MEGKGGDGAEPWVGRGYELLNYNAMGAKHKGGWSCHGRQCACGCGFAVQHPSLFLVFLMWEDCGWQPGSAGDCPIA